MSPQNASRHSTPLSPGVASVVVTAHGAQIFRRVQEEEGSNADNHLAHELVLPKIIRASIGVSLRIDHQQKVFQAGRSLTGRWLQDIGCHCKTKSFCKELKASASFRVEHKPCAKQ